jgi:predicted porin
LTYTSNVAHLNSVGDVVGNARWALGSGNIDENRFGLRGVEDLGGGLKAVFTLEQGFDLSNGHQLNTGKMFSRQAFVGLSSQAGTVTLGRQYDQMQDFVAPLTATGSWGGTNFAHFGNEDRLNKDSSVSYSNTIKFTSANYAGFSFGGTYGFSNSPQFANNREYSFGAGYENAGLRIGAGYAQQNSPFGNSSGVMTASNPDGTPFIEAAHRDRQFGAGASYAFGPAVVGLAWTQARFDNFADGSVSAHINNYEVNARYNLTPALGLGVAYTYSNGSTDDHHFHINQVGLQGDYALSKRTDIYAQGVYQLTSTEHGYFLPAEIGNAGGISSSRRQAVASVGMRHRF